MPRYVGFLRAVNVGGKTSLSMAKVRQALTDIGLTNVSTYLQSGNVLFETSVKSRAELENSIESELTGLSGRRVVILVRTGAELDGVISANPFAEEAKTDPSHLTVLFASRPPDANSLAEVSSAYDGPERIEVRGEHIYVHYPAGIGESKLSRCRPWAKIIACGTARNWNTVRKLADLARS